MLEQLLELDKELFLYLNGLGTTTWDGFWMFMTKNTKSAIPLYLLLLYLSYRYFSWKGTLVILVGVALLITASDQLANLFKYGFERLRPCHDDTVSHLMRLVKPYCGGKYTFFSAHASTSFAVATYFSLIFKDKVKWLPLLLIVWALLVAYSRIYIGVHFPLDVITGISIGMLIGWIFFSFRNLAVNKFNL